MSGRSTLRPFLFEAFAERFEASVYSCGISIGSSKLPP